MDNFGLRVFRPFVMWYHCFDFAVCRWPRIWGYSSTAVPTIIHDNGVILLDRWVIYQVLSKLLDDSLTGSVFIGEKATCGSGMWNLLVKNDLIASQIRNTI
jgi:hypothetical protein